MKKLLLVLLVVTLLLLPTVAYAANPPVVFTMIPNSGPKSGGTTITITGNNFKPGSAVIIGGLQALKVTASLCNTYDGTVNCGLLTAVTPGLGFGTVGTPVSVIVVNPNGLAAYVPSGFTYY